VNREFLAIVAKIHPEAWDAIVPRYAGVVRRSWVEQAGEQVGLNPQPLPPKEAAIGARLLADLLDRAIIVVGGRGGDLGAAFLEEVDDWCGTGWPKWHPKPPRPPWGWDDRAVFTGAALQAAVLSGQFDHNPELQETLLAAGERLGAAAG
jgi:hypothetical protein